VNSNAGLSPNARDSVLHKSTHVTEGVHRKVIVRGDPRRHDA